MSEELLLRPILLMVLLLCFLASCVLASPPASGQMKAFQMREDYGAEPLSDCYLQYYYYIPCPTYSWFWSLCLHRGDVVGAFFEVGDMSTGTGLACDPEASHTLETIRILDYAGYGTIYPGQFTIQMDVYCSDELGCPVGPSLWTSGPVETHFRWNYIDVDPPLCLTPCSTIPSPVPAAPRVLVTATMTGTDGIYPQWGFDNISTPLEMGCVMHDTGCLPAIYPRPVVSHYDRIHSGYYYEGLDYLWHCPPLWFRDGREETPDASQFGHIELAWRIYLSTTGPSAGEPTTWGNIKSIYR